MGQTVSAYTDDVTAKRIAQLAEVESRSPAQIAASALRLYVNLPTEAHQAFRQIEAMKSPAVSDSVQRAVTRALLDGAYSAVRDRMVAQMRTNGVAGSSEAGEDDILAEAVRLTTSPQ
jgi:hypothetical protein